MASIDGYDKYIYHFDKQPEELYDLEEDPLEKNNLAEQVPSKVLKMRREELLEWRSKAAAAFDKAPPGHD